MYFPLKQIHIHIAPFTYYLVPSFWLRQLEGPYGNMVYL